MMTVPTGSLNLRRARWTASFGVVAGKIAIAVCRRRLNVRQTAKRLALTGVIFLLPGVLASQHLQGKVIDQSTNQPLVGATVQLLGSKPLQGSNTDSSGLYTLGNIPPGRYSLRCTYLGYRPHTATGIIVGPNQTNRVDFGMEASAFQTEAAEVVGSRFSNDAVNPFFALSTRSFSGEETNLFPASINDPGRVAQSFPGVQQGNFDTENDIIARGNSSIGIAWQLEGIAIHSPNHFARVGGSGGGLSIFSAALIDRSDFSTGGMPAEYGNALSGVMDISFRPGNTEQAASKARLSLIGMDIATEGPIQKGRSSYLANYRFSTLGLLSQLGVPVLGERVINTFQDLSFNCVFESRDQRTTAKLFGLGGRSYENYQPVDVPSKRDPNEIDDWEERQRGSDLGVLGLSTTHLINEQSWIRLTLSAMGNRIWRENDTLSLVNERYRYASEDFRDNRLALSVAYLREINTRWRMKAGLQSHAIHYSFFKEDQPRDGSDELPPGKTTTVDSEGTTSLWRGYVQNQIKLSPKLTAVLGVNTLYLAYNDQVAVDPRGSLSYTLDSKQRLSLSVGRYSQHLALPLFHYQQADGQRPNTDLPFLQSHHLILGYQKELSEAFRIQVELYLQRLDKVPVSPNPADTQFWLLNNKSGFDARPMISAGKGMNYGFDLSMEHFFTRQFFVLGAVSHFESTYTPLNRTSYPSRYHSAWVSSLTCGKEWKINGQNTLLLGGRTIWNGGQRYTPIDLDAAQAAGYYVPNLNAPWSAQLAPYFRTDARIAYRIFRPYYTLLLSLDIQNLTNRQNERGVRYDRSSRQLQARAHPGGLIPLLGIACKF